MCDSLYFRDQDRWLNPFNRFTKGRWTNFMWGITLLHLEGDHICYTLFEDLTSWVFKSIWWTEESTQLEDGDDKEFDAFLLPIVFFTSKVLHWDSSFILRQSIPSLS